MKLTRKQNAEGVLAHLRAVGPQTAAEIQQSLGITKREVEDALWLLGTQAKVEYAYPMRAPLAYEAADSAAMREP